ncbi:MAG: Beta-galactosidase C-terminal domain [Deltaproteobacteria bacterium]|nr:Beta-galactosidase C-terminal domain [Deltaproteobacteria bacterium]
MSRWTTPLVLALFSASFVGCADEIVDIFPESGVTQDGSISQRDNGITQDGGGTSDVVVYNDGNADGPVANVDTGPVADACVPLASCSVLITYPKGSETSVELRGDFQANGWENGVALQDTGSQWETTLQLDNGLRFIYKFVINGTDWVADPVNSDTEPDGLGGVNSVWNVSCGEPCADSGVVTDGPIINPTFDWRDAVMYFVLLDRFSNGDQSNDKQEGVEWAADYQGGDLQGLIDKVKSGYFKALGVNALWISSPIDAPEGRYAGDDGHDYTGYHGYWPTDLTKIEARVGTLDKLKELVTEAHSRDIKILMDYVMNHVHENSPTYANHKDWFWSLDYNGKTCICGDACSWETVPENLRCWFDPFLPDFDFTNATARQFSIDNAVDWAKKAGIDGYRLDAVKHIEISWVENLRQRMGSNFYMVGETFTGDKGTIARYVGSTMLDGQFDFPLRWAMVQTLLMRKDLGGSYPQGFEGLDKFLQENKNAYWSGAVMGTFLGNHDLPRIIHLAEDQPLFGEWDSGKDRAWSNQPSLPSYNRPFQRVAVAYTALMTLPGVPLIYYGDEVGMAGAGDPDNRRSMEWSGYNVDQITLKDHIAKVGKIRAEHPALRRGYPTKLVAQRDVYAYEMVDGSDRIVVVLNRSDSAQSISINGQYTDLLTGSSVDGSSLSIPARSSMILE